MIFLLLFVVYLIIRKLKNHKKSKPKLTSVNEDVNGAEHQSKKYSRVQMNNKEFNLELKEKTLMKLTDQHAKEFAEKCLQDLENADLAFRFDRSKMSMLDRLKYIYNGNNLHTDLPRSSAPSASAT